MNPFDELLNSLEEIHYAIPFFSIGVLVGMVLMLVVVVIIYKVMKK